MEDDLLAVSLAIEEALAHSHARPGDLRTELAPLRAERDRLIVCASAAGLNNRQIAALAGVTHWQVIKVRRRHESQAGGDPIGA